MAVPLSELRRVLDVQRGQTERRLLPLGATDFFAQFLLGGGAVQKAGGQIETSRLQERDELFRIQVRLRQPLPQPPKPVLLVNHPGVEQEQQTQNPPARLFESRLIKVLAVVKESRESS